MSKFHNNDVLVRVFATKGGFTTQEWWITEASEGRRATFDSYQKAVIEADLWRRDLKAFGLLVAMDNHAKNALKNIEKEPSQWTSRTIKPVKSQEEIYEDMVGNRSSYGVRLW